MANIGESILYDIVRMLRWAIVRLLGLIGSLIKHFVNKTNNAPKK